MKERKRYKITNIIYYVDNWLDITKNQSKPSRFYQPNMQIKLTLNEIDDILCSWNSSLELS